MGSWREVGGGGSNKKQNERRQDPKTGIIFSGTQKFPNTVLSIKRGKQGEEGFIIYLFCSLIHTIVNKNLDNKRINTTRPVPRKERNIHKTEPFSSRTVQSMFMVSDNINHINVLPFSPSPSPLCRWCYTISVVN